MHEAEKNNNSIYVRNFPENFTEKDAQRLFWTFKEYNNCAFKESITYNYAFVNFNSIMGVQQAIKRSVLIYFQDEGSKYPLQLYAS